MFQKCGIPYDIPGEEKSVITGCTLHSFFKTRQRSFKKQEHLDIVDHPC